MLGGQPQVRGDQPDDGLGVVDVGDNRAAAERQQHYQSPAQAGGCRLRCRKGGVHAKFLDKGWVYAGHLTHGRQRRESRGGAMRLCALRNTSDRV